VNGMFGSDIPLGILPGGTANLCVRELKIPVRIPDAIRVIGRNKTKQISVGMANRRYFLLMVGVGFDSEVIKNVDWNLKKKIGTLAFGVAALKTAASYKFPKFTVKVDHTEKECIFAVICNGKEYGAYFQLVPEADLSDDFFYVCLFKEPGFASMVNYALHGFVSMHHKLKSVEIFKARKIEVKGAEEIPVQADRELIGYLPMKIKLLPKSLHIFVP
jgi:diacylglycerol kinase (ATP)